MPTVVTKNFRSRVITAAEEKAIFSAITKRANSEPTRSWTRFAHLIRFLLDTGCRLGEALNLSDALIEADGDATFVTFSRYSTKNDEPRKLPPSKAIIASLPYLRSCAVGGKLFPMKPQTVWYMWNSIRSDLVAAGLPVNAKTVYPSIDRTAEHLRNRYEMIGETGPKSAIPSDLDELLL